MSLCHLYVMYYICIYNYISTSYISNYILNIYDVYGYAYVYTHTHFHIVVLSLHYAFFKEKTELYPILIRHPPLSHPFKSPMSFIPFFMSMCTHYSGPTCKWKHIVCDFLFLSLLEIMASSIQLVPGSRYINIVFLYNNLKYSIQQHLSSISQHSIIREHI